jgi:hypothetical protein
MIVYESQMKEKREVTMILNRFTLSRHPKWLIGSICTASSQMEGETFSPRLYHVTEAFRDIVRSVPG